MLPGSVAERIQSVADPQQAYAVYLPSQYTGERAWPVLFLMDPRGRALVPIESFREAAEIHGWVLVSSYNTRSDVEFDRNAPALEAMMRDVGASLSLDERRIYLGGLSGTARAAWFYARQMPDNLAGIIGFGAGLLLDFSLPESARYTFFGAAGETDFNYDEMRELDETLDAHGIRHRLVSFTGGHQWGPPETAHEALDWMELMAMRDGRLSRDQAALRESFVDALMRASVAVETGQTMEAYARFEAIVEDFDGLWGITVAQARAASLATDLEVQRSLALQDLLARRNRAYVDRFHGFLDEVRQTPGRLDVAAALDRLEIDEIRRDTKGADPLITAAAQRLLEVVFVRMSYYDPLEMMKRGRPDLAIDLLRVAAVIKPDHPRVLLNMARAHAQIGDLVSAEAARRRALEIAPAYAAELLGDPYFYDTPPSSSAIRTSTTPTPESPRYRDYGIRCSDPHAERSLLTRPTASAQAET